VCVLVVVVVGAGGRGEGGGVFCAIYRECLFGVAWGWGKGGNPTHDVSRLIGDRSVVRVCLVGEWGEGSGFHPPFEPSQHRR
jgi:hypothetical protein